MQEVKAKADLTPFLLFFRRQAYWVKRGSGEGTESCLAASEVSDKSKKDVAFFLASIDVFDSASLR